MITFLESNFPQDNLAENTNNPKASVVIIFSAKT